jgi:hypothetical protein
MENRHRRPDLVFYLCDRPKRSQGYVTPEIICLSDAWQLSEILEQAGDFCPER